MKKDFINIQDFSEQELLKLIELISVMKKAYKERVLPDLLHKYTLTMLFLGSSLRTRMSFEVAMTSLGGHALYIKPGDIHLGKKESIEDTAIVMGSLCDGILIRSPNYKDISEIAKYSSTPVLNGMADDANHPTQVLCDVFTMFEKTGKIKGINLSFVGDTSDGFGVIGRDLMLICSKLGINYNCASPKEYCAEDSYMALIQKNAGLSGAQIVLKEDPKEVIGNADFLTCDAFTWYGFEEETKKRLSVFMPKYQVNSGLLKLAPSDCKFLHCLPANRGEEVTSEVVDCDQSIVFDQAENRLHTELALCAAFLADEKSIEKLDRNRDKNKYDDQIIKIIKELHAL